MPSLAPSLLGAAASSDQGGITGFLLDLVDKLGAVGVGLTILIETVIPPIPSEAVLGAAGVLINSGRMSIVPVIFFATLGSLTGALFFYAIGRALGPERSRAFLNRLPLVEDEDVENTFGWFERHGRPAVLFGRMVPLVRSFISVPAGVVRMPLGQFVFFTAIGSLIWNTVLVTLGVAAGDFIERNLHYFDYVVVAALVLAVAWMVFRRAKDVYRRRSARTGGRKARGRAPGDDPEPAACPRPSPSGRDPRSWRSTSTRPCSTSHRCGRRWLRRAGPR